MSAQTNGSSAVGDEAEEATVSLDDINQENREMRELEADARAVLGNSDAEHCTWDQGYVSRQALYACVTCRTDAKDSSTRAGICLACSYDCHEGHELVELYTKRNFRCDCGNHKFAASGGGDAAKCCKLAPHKDVTGNPDNVYNQNYDGLYCTCHRPYPDPEDTVEDEMIQCVVCEDWYHSRHLNISPNCNGGKVPEEYHEMICHLCAAKHPFLSSYAKSALIKADASDVTSATNAAAVDPNNVTTGTSTNAAAGETDSRKRKLSGEGNCRLKRTKQSQTDRSETTGESSSSSSPSSSSSTALFFSEGWRSTLCTCANCQKMYEDENIAFLTQEEDSVGAYEAAGAAQTGLGGEEEEEAALGNLLGGMDRFQQGELIAGYNDMKTALNEYLRQFAEQGKVVKAEDIRNFFEAMEAKKKAKGNPQYYCG